MSSSATASVRTEPTLISPDTIQRETQPPADPPRDFAGVSARASGDADLPFLRALYRSTRAEEMAAVGWPAAAAETFCDQQFEMQRRTWAMRDAVQHALILHRDDVPLGRLWLDERGADVRVVDISLMPEARGQGVGTAVLREVIARAERAGKGIALSVDPFNIRAFQLYLRLGFAPVGEEPGRIHMRRPPHRDA